MKYLNNLDIFGPVVHLKIQGQDKYQSPIGVCLTFVYLILIALGLFVFGRDLFEKKVPQVAYNRQIRSEAQFNLTSENLAFAIYNQNDNSLIKDINRKFHFYMHRFFNFKGGYTEEKFFFEKCDPNVFTRWKKSVLNAEHYYCLKKGTVISIDGVFDGSETSSTGRLNIDFCINGVDNRTDCISKNETMKTMGNIAMNILLDDYFSNSLDYSYPFQYNQFSTQLLTTGSTFSRINFNFKSIEYTTDVGVITESNSVKNVTAIESSDSVSFATTGNTIYSHMFANSKWKDSFNRTYIKIQGVFAFLGGFISIVDIFLKILCKVLIFPDLVHLFHTKYVSQDKRSNQLKEPSFIINILPKSLNLSETNPIKAIQNKRRSTGVKYIKFSKFTFIEKLLRCFPARGVFEQKKEFYEKYKHMLGKKFSIEHFSTMSRKIKIFENLLFNKNTRQLFKYVDVPHFEKSKKNYDELVSIAISNLQQTDNEFDKYIAKNLTELLTI